MSYDWSTFSQKMKIKAPAEKIYRSWVTRVGLESWFLRMAEFSRAGIGVIADNESLAVGDTYRWRWHGYPDDVTETGEILDLKEGKMLKFRFGNAGNVTFEVNDIAENLSEITITQSEIPTDEAGIQNYHLGCSTGWTFYRCNLKSIMEGSIDLRNIGNDNDRND